jgi:hypothetical protein
MMQKQDITNMGRNGLVLEEGKEKGHKTIQKIPVVEGTYYTALLHGDIHLLYTKEQTATRCWWMTKQLRLLCSTFTR